MSVQAVGAFLKAEALFQEEFEQLATAQARLHRKLQEYADGKVLKGNELVGWLGEVYGKLLFNGWLVNDSHEHDVETSDKPMMRICVKTRKGNEAGWSQCSAIPLIDGDTCPTHLLFVHLTDQYLVRKMWLFPWGKLLEGARFRKHVVRGQFRSYFIRVSEKRDEVYCIYTRDPAAIRENESS